jgi:hypothetical protein
MLPDVVGFRTGTPLAEAYNQLKAYNAKLPIQAGEALVPELSDKKLPYAVLLSEGSAFGDRIRLDVTFPPNAQVVWRVSREVGFAAGQAPTRTNMVAQLRKKYGAEYPPDNASQGNAMLTWLFDERGQRAVEGGGLTYRNCHGVLSSGAFVATTVGDSIDTAVGPPLSPYFQLSGPLDGPPARTMPAFRPCQSLIVVNVFLGAAADPNLIALMLVTMTDAGLRGRAYQATFDYVSKVRAGKAKKDLDSAGQRPTPKL